MPNRRKSQFMISGFKWIHSVDSGDAGWILTRFDDETTAFENEPVEMRIFGTEGAYQVTLDGVATNGLYDTLPAAKGVAERIFLDRLAEVTKPKRKRTARPTTARPSH